MTLAGPPTLIPRGIEELGCEISYTLDDLPTADVVYALRMQHERMTDSFVPSLREYAINYQINPRRLGPRQLLDAPGPRQPRGRARPRGDRRPELADHRRRWPAGCSSGWRSSTRSSLASDRAPGPVRGIESATDPTPASPIGEPA